MDILNYPVPLNRALGDTISCDFCALQFGTATERNAHILNHFEHQICQSCDQTVLRIGGNFYILHATSTCISTSGIKQEAEWNESIDNGIALIKVHPIDARQFSEDFVKKQEIDTDCLGSVSTNFDVPNLTAPTDEASKPIEQVRQLTDADEINIEIEFHAEDTVAVPASESQTFEPSLTNKRASKLSNSKHAVKKYDCSKCGSKNLAKSSFMQYHKSPNFKCRECGTAFCQFTRLKDHYKVHPGADPYDGILVRGKQSMKEVEAKRKVKKFHCPVDGCNEMVSTYTRRNHLKTKHRLFRFECDYCKKSYKDLSSIREHMAVHGATSERYTCDMCGTSNIKKAAAKRSHSKQNFVCIWCDRRFCLREHLKQHQLNDRCVPGKPAELKSEEEIDDTTDRHNIPNLESTANHIDAPSLDSAETGTNEPYGHIVCVNGKYDCTKCGSKSVSKASFLFHHKIPNYKCKECGVAFCQFTRLKDHYYKVHPGADPYDGVDVRSKKSIRYVKAQRKIKKIQCPIDGCNEMVSINTRKAHLKTKHRLFRFECDYCKKSFSTLALIRDHMNIHASNGKKFKCDSCHRVYDTEHSLDIHYKKSHIKGKTFQCTECGKTFYDITDLKIHETKHTGEKLFACTFEGCSKTFRLRSTQYGHLRTHTGEKPYECPIADCGRKFMYGIDLKRHKHSAHGIFTKQFPCHCGKIFPENSLLKRHMKQHELRE